jgi:UDP-N-acetylmuramate dehydrogenase
MLMPGLERAGIHQKLGVRLKENELLAPHTTFRIGGPADLFVRANSRADLIEFTYSARVEALPLFILGNGSNILVADAGIRGLVVEDHADDYVIAKQDKSALLSAESGVSLPGLASRLSRQGWSGLEWAIGVPSTVGAAIVGNAGAHGGSIGAILTRAELLDPDGGIEWRPGGELSFAYRTTGLKESPRKEIVLRGEFRLEREDPAVCIARLNKYSEHRRRTQPTEPSVGSMFKNPPGDYAGRLIEAAGLKMTRVGRVEVSAVHANFFVNLGGATAREVLGLIELVRQKVKETFGVELELEIQLVGDWDEGEDDSTRSPE